MKKYIKNKELLKQNHVYSDDMEHDACGVGIIASTEGKKSRKVVEYGIEALKAVWHRGAVDADGKTGDGAGIHVEIPKDFFVEKIEVTGHTHDNSEIGVGMIFLPRNDYEAQESCKTIVESELTKNGFSIYGWRQVPINPNVLGEKALQTMPEIIQVLFKSYDPELTNKDLERKIYETRRKIENEAFKKSLNHFYICSLSSKSIIYKGMFLAEAISDFYLDLKDERFISRFAIFHQRFSTNTAPSWNLAQPFRAIAHNGEINTFRGNKNWMKVHEQEMNSNLFENIENLKPVIQQGTSDSAALDNVFELLNISGQPAPLAKLMLVPDAWSKKNETLPKDHQQLFNFLNSTMEPWDGPAAIAGTDNEWVIAANDRNGLRPLRYAITKDKLLFAGSETGMIELNEKRILSKGRLGPGEIIGVRIEKGKVFKNKQIKDYLAKEYKHFNSQIIDLDEKLTISDEKNSYSGDELRRRQYAFGISLEDLELILHPMAEDAKEAIGSMGDDTPLAVLSDRYRPLYHFFRQNFSQVTNPPIDSLRENKVMSLKTRFGNLGNILDFDNLTKEDIFVLSKGHGCLAYYSLLVQMGHITIDELKNFGKKDSKLGGHPDRNKIKNVYASTGSLGHGFPISVGTALAKKIKGDKGKVICLIGDGEANEGSIWESFMIASKNKLNNLVCIIDNNNSQIRSLPSESLGDKLTTFGWGVWDVDGHDVDNLVQIFENVKNVFVKLGRFFFK